MVPFGNTKPDKRVTDPVLFVESHCADSAPVIRYAPGVTLEDADVEPIRSSRRTFHRAGAL
jgi:hypothetical protein